MQIMPIFGDYYRQYPMPYIQPHIVRPHSCPNCGYCSHCGRSGYRPPPMPWNGPLVGKHQPTISSGIETAKRILHSAARS